MANAEHLGILRQGVDAWNRWRKECPETCPDLSGADLAGAALSRRLLDGADFHDANFSGAVLDFSILGGADPSRANLRGASLGGCMLPGTNLREADLTGACLIEACMEGVDLRGARLDDASLDLLACDARTIWPLGSEVYPRRWSVIGPES
jgi:uncharacterized protein YjbI with pentapeptide repeats